MISRPVIILWIWSCSDKRYNQYATGSGWPTNQLCLLAWTQAHVL